MGAEHEPSPRSVPRLYRWRTNLIQTPAFSSRRRSSERFRWLVSLFDKTGRAQHRIAQMWARGCVLDLRLPADGARRWRTSRKHPVAVYASNHTSYMDTPVVFASLPFQFRILAKKEFWTLAFIGWYLDRSGQIPIDTENPHATLSSLGAGVKALRAGMPLFVFPEGARTPDGELQTFLSGAAYLAIRAQVPLVPMALSGVYDLLPIHTRHFYPRGADADGGRADCDGGHAVAAGERVDGAAAGGDRGAAGGERPECGCACRCDGVTGWMRA